jgi:xanthine dehydrogenase molybdopterin-binding subunit B
VGEPPLLLSCSVLYALEAAARAAAAETFKCPAPASVHLAIPATVQAIKKAVGVRPLAEILPSK